MAYTKSALITLINQYIGRADLSDFTDDFLNMAIYRVARSHNWRALQADAKIDLVADTASYDFPTSGVDGNAITIKNILSARLDDNAASGRSVTVVAWIPAERFDLLYPDYEQVTAARPRVGSDWRKKIVLYPRPDSGDYDLLLRVDCWPQPMTNDTDTLVFGDHVADAVIAAACAEAFLSTDEQDKATYWEQVLERKIRAAALADAGGILPISNVKPPTPTAPNIIPGGV